MKMALQRAADLYRVSIMLKMMATFVANGATIFLPYKTPSEAQWTRKIILEGTKWEDTCFVISCEGQTNCDSVMMEIFVQ
jgi:hypothetical protein